MAIRSSLNLFYAPELEPGMSLLELSREESLHCCRSLRMAAGDSIVVTNGRGIKANCIITKSDVQHCEVDVTDIIPALTRGFRLHMAVAPTKNHDRFEWFVEKATELGVEAIIPLICTRSERRKVQAERLHRIMVAAMKQSERCLLPELRTETSFAQLMEQQETEQRLIAWCGDESRQLLIDTLAVRKNALILVGPEGDFTNEEVQAAIKNSFVPISLGKARLRTETAGVAACHIFNLKNEVL